MALSFNDTLEPRTRPLTQPIRAVVISDYPALAQEVGLDPHAELARYGLPPGACSLPDLRVSADAVARLLEGAAERSGCPDFAIRLAQRRKAAHLGVAGLVLIQQPTLRDALDISGRYRHLLNEAVGFSLEEDRQHAILHIALFLDQPRAYSQAVELSVAAYAHLIRLLLGEAWNPVLVRFRHSAPARQALQRRFFGSPLEFDAETNAIVCDATDLDRVNHRADAALAGYASALLDGLPGAPGVSHFEMVRRLIVTLLPMGKASIAAVASAMGLTVRSLQRKLDAAGVDFKTLLSDVRAETCAVYLETPGVTVAQTAERLGYASTPAFIRWFKGRFGVSPGLWRLRRAADELETQAGGL